MLHPNDTFSGEKIVTDNNEEITNIIWDEIDANKLRKISASKEITRESTAFNTLKRKFLEQKKKNNYNIRYLAIIERFENLGITDHIVRGLVKRDNDGFFITFNPAYEKSLSTDTFEKPSR